MHERNVHQKANRWLSHVPARVTQRNQQQTSEDVGVCAQIIESDKTLVKILSYTIDQSLSCQANRPSAFHYHVCNSTPNCPLSHPHDSSPHPSSALRSGLILSSHLRLGIQLASSLHTSRQIICTHFSPLQCILHLFESKFTSSPTYLQFYRAYIHRNVFNFILICLWDKITRLGSLKMQLICVTLSVMRST